MICVWANWTFHLIFASTWHAQIAIFDRPRNVYVHMIKFKGLLRQFENSETKMISEQNFRDHNGYSLSQKGKGLVATSRRESE